MSDDYHGNDNEYWDDMYYYENYNKDMDPNSWSGRPRRTFGTGFWIWLAVFIVAANISTALANILLLMGVVLLIRRLITK